jgi:Zn-dependent peptidase ImmA (M78 family)
MKLCCDFDEAYVEIECSAPFLPYVKGEPARLELCALAAKRALGVTLTAALDPWAAAERVDVEVRGREYIERHRDEVRDQLLVHGRRNWSAMTMVFEGEPIILMNPTHDARRQKVTLAEELAHLVMGHPPSTLDPETGIRTYDAEIEDEAYGVGGAMVMPYAQLFSLARAATPARAIAGRFGVSEPFANYRINRAGLRPMYRKRTAGRQR